MVFLVLALTWVAVLTFWYRSRSQQAFSDSVTQFHDHLRVIERAAPVTRVAANRLRGPLVAPLPLGVVTAQPGGAAPERPRSTDGLPAVPVAPARRRAVGGRDRAAATARRRRVQRRRRDVLIVLAVVAIATLVLTLLERIPDAAMAQIGSDVVLGGYLVLLIRANHGGARRAARRRTRATRSLRRLRVRPVRTAGRSTAVDGAWDPAGRAVLDERWQSDDGHGPDDGWDSDDGWESDDGWDSEDGWDSDDRDDRDDTAGFAAVTLRPAVGR